MNRTTFRSAAVLAVSLSLVLTGCSSKGKDSASGSGADGVKTGPGVTADTITLGGLSDLSGPAAALGKNITQAQQLYADQVNAAGGVCGRQLKLVVRDHAYDVQKAVAAYTELQPQVAAFPQLLGSAQTSALLDSIQRDKVLTLPASYASSLLGHDGLRVVGSTYDVDMVNGVEFLVKAAKLKAGDKVGEVYQDNEYGQNALEGAKFAAGKAGLSLVEQAIKPTDTDMTAQVTALKAAGVKAIVFNGTPAQTASLVGVAAASGLRVPVLTSGPGYVPQLLGTPAKPALEKMLFVAGQFPALGSGNPAIAKLVADYKAKYPDDTISQAILSGTVFIAITVDALKAACQAKDLSRDGVLAGLATLKSYKDIVGETHDLSDPAKVSITKSYILQPDSTAVGGVKVVQSAFEASAMTDYLASAKK